MKSVIILALISLSVLADRHEDIINGSIEPTEEDYQSLYKQFQQEYQEQDHYIYQTYASVDRYQIFKESIQRWQKHNSDPATKWTMGLTKFADMTNEEFVEAVNLNNGLKAPQEKCNATAELTLKRPWVKNQVNVLDIPPVDWRQLGVVSPVKNQGHCGSCWAFSTIAAVESHTSLSTRTLPPPDLSEQQLVDCAGHFENEGCNGGLPSHGFDYIRWAGGVTTNKIYPYKAVDQSCRYDVTQAKAFVPGGSINITSMEENELLTAVAYDGPVSIAYQVSEGFKDYTKGVWSGPCNNTAGDVNHAVLAVGFGTDNGTDYWAIKNSWGETWGNKGYFNMERGVNMCGVATCASYPNMRG